LIQNNPKNAPLHPWEWPAWPWQRIHIDFAEPLSRNNVSNCCWCLLEMARSHPNDKHKCVEDNRGTKIHVFQKWNPRTDPKG
jgi:hypothetical protein